MSTPKFPLPWLEPSDSFPPVENAWGPDSDAPGLLAAGADLSVPTLARAYANGIFPWFSEGQPVLWWSTNPRMVLKVANFKAHHSLRKTLKNFVRDARCEIRFDSAFAKVIQSCAHAPRRGHAGTWIVPAMVDAYTQLHAAGLAHSVETWIDGELAGGLYCMALGKAVFGESMFANRTDASKIALAALVAFCRAQGVTLIDCQQNTSHLASMGAAEIPRTVFVDQVQHARVQPPLPWHFDPLYWNHILGS